jgi:hypothetical protein
VTDRRGFLKGLALTAGGLLVPKYAVVDKPVIIQEAKNTGDPIIIEASAFTPYEEGIEGYIERFDIDFPGERYVYPDGFGYDGGHGMFLGNLGQGTIVIKTIGPFTDDLVRLANGKVRICVAEQTR